MSVNYGSKRVVTGAHYGLRDWLAQRITAAIMALFTLILLVQVLFSKGPLGYYGWAGIFSAQWMKALTFAVFLALTYHVWVGMRDIWMDYVKPAGHPPGAARVHHGLAAVLSGLGRSSSLEALKQ